MKSFYTLVILSIAAVASQASTQVIKHTIKTGETLYTIAHANHTTIEEVRKANSIKKGEILKLGRVLKVPVDTYFPNKKKLVFSKNISKKIKHKNIITKHTIKAGETLYDIAHKNHTTTEEIRKANNIKKGEKLKIGRILRVPVDIYFPNEKKIKLSKKNIKTIKHTIKTGETLYTIAHANHTTIEEVRKANSIKKGEILKLGRVLKVPVDTYFPKKNQVLPIKQIAKVSKRKAKTIKTTKRKKKEKNTLKIAARKYSKKIPKNNADNILFRTPGKNFSASKKSTRIINLAKKKLGKRYVWGATGKRNTFDCSGLTKYVYKKNGINLPRTSINQAKYGRFVKRSNLKPGDLVFFDTSKRRKGYVNHVGIYIGNNKFLHASSAKKRVVITSLNAKFYSSRYKGARRPS